MAVRYTSCTSLLASLTTRSQRSHAPDSCSFRNSPELQTRFPVTATANRGVGTRHRGRGREPRRTTRERELATRRRREVHPAQRSSTRAWTGLQISAAARASHPSGNPSSGLGPGGPALLWPVPAREAAGWPAKAARRSRIGPRSRVRRTSVRSGGRASSIFPVARAQWVRKRRATSGRQARRASGVAISSQSKRPRSTSP